MATLSSPPSKWKIVGGVISPKALVNLSITDADISPTAAISADKLDLSNVTQAFKTNEFLRFLTALAVGAVENNSLFLSSLDTRIHIKDNVGADNTVAYLSDIVSMGNTVLVSEYVTKETPTGVVDGLNTVFSLAFTPELGTEEVYLNGLQQDPGGANDYTIAGIMITFAVAPLAGEKIRVSYIK